MTMRRYRISHHTHMAYNAPVRASHNELRMTPVTEPGQTTLDNRIRIKPVTWSTVYRDHWSTHVMALESLDTHDVLDIESVSIVERTTMAPQDSGAGWDGIAEEPVRDRLYEWLMPTARTGPGAAAAEIADQVRSLPTPRDAALAVCDLVRQQLRYVPGSTAVHSTGEQAWADRRGVCQDFAHVAIGVLRELGIPARYVSGYLDPGHDTEVGESSEGQSHAWVEFWDGHWHGADPTNGLPVGLGHVVVARGRDYDDVPPLKGVYSGQGVADLTVTVRFTRLA